MNRLLYALALVLVMALAATAIARAPAAPAPPGNAYGAYGCCCPWSAHLGICPVTPGELLSSFDDVCEIHEIHDDKPDEFKFSRYCDLDKPGKGALEGEIVVYPYRGMTLREIALLFYGYGFLETPNVAGILDLLCRYERD